MSDIQVFNNLPPMKTISQEAIAKINNRLPELRRGQAMIGHSTSQTSYSLQTMNMISDSPLSRMKQCLAQINQKYEALRENYFKLEEKKLEVKELSKNTDEKSRLKLREFESSIESIGLAMENTLRQIGMFQDMYDSIRKNNNVPEDWTEKDFEKQEIEHMIRSSFRLGIQNLSSTGRVSQAVVEYWEQLGIHPQVAEALTRDYLIQVQQAISENKEVDITVMFQFLDAMVEKFRDSYKLALERMGLNGIGSELYMATGATKPQ